MPKSIKDYRKTSYEMLKFTPLRKTKCLILKHNSSKCYVNQIFNNLSDLRSSPHADFFQLIE